ncbi:unnamed protein product, partial [Strongylus vulgaris]
MLGSIFILVLCWAEPILAQSQWARCAGGYMAIMVNASETIYALNNDSSVFALPPGTQCNFQITPISLTVVYISVTGSNFTNTTVVAFYEGNTANPIYINSSNPIEYTFPPSAVPYLVVVKRLPNEQPATFAMKIRGEQ